MGMTIPKSYAVFDLKVREFLQDRGKREYAMRMIATAILKELTFVESDVGMGDPLLKKRHISYDQVLMDLVNEIVMDELGKQHSQAKEANTDGDRA